MLETSHVVVGMAIGKYVPNPLLAFVFSFLSHFILDFIPHWDGDFKKVNSSNSKAPRILTDREKFFSKEIQKVLKCDILASFILFIYFSVSKIIWPNFPDPFSFFNFLIANPSWPLGVLGAILPDLLTYFDFLTGFTNEKCFIIFKKLKMFHKKIQHSATKIQGLVVQAALIISIILVLNN